MMMMFSIKLFTPSAMGADMRLVYVHLQVAAKSAQLSQASSGPACVFEDVIL